MNQTTYKEGQVCGNKKFRYCDVSNKTYKCVNCDKAFTDELKNGQIITGDCDECGVQNVDIKIHTRYTDGGVLGDCLKCVTELEAITELYTDFRGEGYGYENENFNSFSNEKFVKDRNEALEKIASLPKDQLICFLRNIHGAVER